MLINKKINLIMPLGMAENHDGFIKRFLETAKRNVLNHIVQLFAVTAEGYL
jgi:hypothetical protein